MLDEEVQKARFVVLDLRELFQDCVGYEVGTAGAGGEGELLLKPGTKSLGHTAGERVKWVDSMYQDIVNGAVQMFGLVQSSVLRGAAAGK